MKTPLVIIVCIVVAMLGLMIVYSQQHGMPEGPAVTEEGGYGEGGGYGESGGYGEDTGGYGEDTGGYGE
jgi:hypothetical protein